MTKIRNFDSLGGIFPHFCPNKREIWHGVGPLPVLNFTFIGAKAIFGLLSKNDSGMAALRAGMPVIKLEINMHHLSGAMQLSDCDEILCR